MAGGQDESEAIVFPTSVPHVGTEQSAIISGVSADQITPGNYN